MGMIRLNLESIFFYSPFSLEKIHMRKSLFILIPIFLTNILMACSPQVEQASETDQLKVLTTTSIVGDVVSHIGGKFIELSVLLPPGTDPHNFDPTPQDVAKLAEADVIFANGAGLETFLDKVIENVEVGGKVVFVSEGIDLLLSENNHVEEGRSHADEEFDPHVWTNPKNVLVWVDNIESKLIAEDPSKAEVYKSNAENYKDELEALDEWIRNQVDMIPEENRKMITDHTFLAYFTSHYGFEQIGTLIPGGSTLAEPSAQELATIENLFDSYHLNVIFVGNTVNPALAERVAEDTGARLVFLYTGSLGDPGSGIETYLDYMRYNTSAIVGALK